jgi:hypothetical protein
MDPSKFQLLYYQMSTETTTTTMPTAPSPLSTPAYSSQNCSGFYISEQYLPQDYNNPTEAFENFILNEAEKLYETLLEDSIDKTISNVPNDISPNVQSSSLLRRTEPFDIKNSVISLFDSSIAAIYYVEFILLFISLMRFAHYLFTSSFYL